MGNDYIKALFAPTPKKQQGRKVWSIDLENVWLPFFTATNAMGDSAIPSEALGAPLRLGYDKAGAVQFTQAGRPVIRVAKEIGESVRLVRDNFTANLLNYAGQVMRDNAEDYKAQIDLSREAGNPIIAHDRNQLTEALEAQAEAMKAEAEAKKAEVSRESELVTA